MREKTVVYIKLLIFWFVFLYGNHSYAVSFDCAKASSSVESMICSDKELSILDDALGDLFNAVKTREKKAITSQKEWLRDQRNLCNTKECLRLVYKNRIEYLKTLERCPVEALAIIGNWVRSKGEGFEEMKFLVNGKNQTFLSWIHHKPEMTGVWTFEQCIIHIRHGDQDGIQFDLKVKELDKNKLFVMDMDSSTEAVYEKMLRADK